MEGSVPLKDRVRLLTTAAEVDEFLERNPNSAIFKAGTCHKTQETLQRVQTHIETREDLPFGFIRVVEARPASNRVTEITGISHESPQLVLFRDGQAIFHRDNWEISGAALAEALREHFTPA
jgi:bacillithiol system protein YtxJ